MCNLKHFPFFSQSCFFKICVIYPRGFSQSTAQKTTKLILSFIHSFIVAYFKNNSNKKPPYILLKFLLILLLSVVGRRWCNVHLKHFPFFSQSFFSLCNLPRGGRSVHSSKRVTTGPYGFQRVPTGPNGSQRVPTQGVGEERLMTPNRFEGVGEVWLMTRI
jgi:hypothetical protein